MPLIKRYPNRKLYNTETKEYITLDGIADLVRAGEEIHVIDHATGQDLTALTLSQVLFELVKQQTGLLPRAVVAGLIQAGGSRISAVQRVLFSSFGLKQQVDDEIRRRIVALIERGELEPPEGGRLLDLLLALGGEPVQPPLKGELVEEILARRGVPSRQDLQALLDKMDALAARLDDIDPQDAPAEDAPAGDAPAEQTP